LVVATTLLTRRRGESAPNSKARAKMTLILQSVALSRVLERPEIPNEQLWYTRSDRLRRYARECIALRFVSLYRCLSWHREQTRGGRHSGRMGTYERLVHRFEDAEGTPWQGEAVSDAAFWSGTLAVSWATVPDTTDLEAPVYRARGPCSRAVGIAFRRTRPQLARNGRSA
jgi:hypothetical protein